MAEKKRIDEPTGTQTVGHEWDGIEELDTPMPRWWVWTFYATILWALIYVVLYPAIPLVNSATAGIWNWSSRGQLNQEMSAETARRAPVMRAMAATPVEQILTDAKLRPVAIQGGLAAYKVNCVQCHGTGAVGSAGYPNLLDDDWLWGGDINAIHTTLTHGIRNPDHDETRVSQMPAFGRDGLLTARQISDVTSHVLSLSGAEKASAAATRGAEVFTANCAVCHGADGKGMRSLGAPNLTDNIWLYGGSRAAVQQSIHQSRQGVMPRWNAKLDPVTIKMLAVYVHSLGGGEATVAPDSATAAATATATAAAAPAAAPEAGQ